MQTGSLSEQPPVSSTAGLASERACGSEVGLGWRCRSGWCDSVRPLMASAEEQPPALPVKQHRSHSSFSRSSGEFDCPLLSPFGPQHQNYACNDVFLEPTDCHALQCPIHQLHGSSRHQMRAFSDGTPPPIPKKRLARTFSLPVYGAPPLSPLSPLPRQPQNFDNPVYMLAPIVNTCLNEEFEASGEPPVPLPSLSQLSFDTPDEHLSSIFSSLDNQGVVFQGIQQRHLLFLKSTAQSVHAGILLQGDALERDASSYRPQDFLLSEGSEPKQVGDAVYYSLRSPKLPGRLLALRVHKSREEASSARTRRQPGHVNVQDVIAHFPAQDLPCAPLPGRSAAPPPGEGSTEGPDTEPRSLQCLLMRGLSVSVERDLPQATLQDFVEDGMGAADYDRQVCVLLLQILKASQHLFSISTCAAQLRPQEVFLVWPGREEEDDLKEKMAKQGKIQTLWRTRGPPRVVLAPLSSPASLPHTLIHIKNQIGQLVQYCLHSQESQTSAAPESQSSYRRGLLYLTLQLQSDSSLPQMSDMVAVLQVLLWGPRVPVFDPRRPAITTVHNWLSIRRALLVMRLAERGLIQDQAAPDWEECMCLQYLSFTEPEAAVSVCSQLWLSLNQD